MAKSGVRVLVTLACQDCKRRNYQTNKSKRNSPDRIEFSKYCRWCGQAHAAQGDALARMARAAAQRGAAGAGRSVTAPMAGKPKSQSGGEPVERAGAVCAG